VLKRAANQGTFRDTEIGRVLADFGIQPSARTKLDVRIVRRLLFIFLVNSHNSPNPREKLTVTKNTAGGFSPLIDCSAADGFG